MAKINIKQFCKDFKAYEKKVGSNTAWKQVLDEVGNSAKNISKRSFNEQQSPFNEAWQALSPVTLQKKKGSLKLVESGHLQRSIRTSTKLGKVEKAVSIGSNLEYAAIHQFGGRAGRNRKVTIPARPYLPLNTAGEIAPSLDRAIDRVLSGFLKL